MSKTTVPTTSLPLDSVLLRLLRTRLFMPLLLLGALTVGGIAYLGKEALEIRQRQVAESTAQRVDLFLKAACRTLNSLVRLAEDPAHGALNAAMESSWATYGHFETIYRLDAHDRIVSLAPPDPRHLDLDMSRQPHFRLARQSAEPQKWTISRPFMSLRTGMPAVYLTRVLKDGGLLIGELSLESLQNEFSTLPDRHRPEPAGESIVIMDQVGLLLAHPQAHLVREQANVSTMPGFRRWLQTQATSIYAEDGTVYIGAAARSERIGWLVVARMPLAMAVSPYAALILISFAIAIMIWRAATWSFRRQIQNRIAVPLVRLGELSAALSTDDFSQSSALVALPDAFAELNRLADDFRHMSMTLQVRQEALQQSEERYRSLFERLPIGIFRTTPAGQVLDCNPAFVQMLGHGDRTTLIAKNVKECYVEPDDRKAWQTLVERHGVVRDFETQMRCDNSELIWVRLSMRAVHGEDGNILCYDGCMEDITRQRQAADRIRYMAHHDALTSLPNRTLLQDRIGQAIAQARRERDQVAVLFIDLDGFKHINDSLGHHVGDLVLREVAARLRNCLRESDSVARLGGDEFVICLPAVADGNTAAQLATRLLAALEAPCIVDGQMLHVGGSIGISLYPGDGEDVHTLMRAADTAMYCAKSSGRGHFQFFTPSQNAAIRQRLALVGQLHQALARGEFFLHYQPQVELTSGRIFSCEALIRWQQPDSGLISPADFIPVAEETGMILPIGEWVLREACGQLRRWHQDGHRHLRVAVNLSARQFFQPNFENIVARILAETGVPASALELEITEGLVMQPSDANMATLQRLNDMGVRLSLDDFGTGYSSLAYLGRFPIHALKIDRMFVRGIGHNHHDEAIVSSIIALADSLDLSVVAEGVENADQLAYLATLGCFAVQGFYLGRPATAEDFAELVRQSERQEVLLLDAAGRSSPRLTNAA